MVQRRPPSSVTAVWGALAAYLVVSFVYFGIPLAAHPSLYVLGTGRDPEVSVWSLGWWPHAILHGKNPFITHVVWAPNGVNLAWVNTIPGLALLATPLTLLSGPTFAFNLVGVLLPGLAAWTAFLLCRHLTGSFWPSLGGGYLFGFSSYMLAHLVGHMCLYAVFLVPLIALVIVRFLEGSLSTRRLVILFGALMAFQISFSTDIAFTLSLSLGISMLVAYGLIPSARARLISLIKPLAGGYVLACLLASPLLISALLHFQRESIASPSAYPTDLLNIVVPTTHTWIGWHWTERISGTFTGNPTENGAYLGLPCLAILGGLAWTRWRQPAVRFLTTMLALGVLAELGTALHTEGHRSVWLPWHAIAGLPLFNNVLPVRLSLFVSLGAAIGVAWWAASSRIARWLRIALVLAAVVAIAPHPWLSYWHEHPTRVSFFTDGTYRTCLQASDNVMMLPFPKWNDAMLWQAEAGFSFRMANGYLNSLNPSNATDPGSLESNVPGPDATLVLQWANAQHATMILVDGTQAAPWTTALASLHGAKIGGVYLYAVPGHSSPCVSGA